MAIRWRSVVTKCRSDIQLPPMARKPSVRLVPVTDLTRLHRIGILLCGLQLLTLLFVLLNY